MKRKISGFRHLMAALSKKPAGGGGGAAVNTISLCHFDGSNGATTVTDEVAGVSWLMESTTLTTDVKHFGTASLFINDTGDQNTATGFATVWNSTNWTFEYFARISGTGFPTFDFRDGSGVVRISLGLGLQVPSTDNFVNAGVTQVDGVTPVLSYFIDGNASATVNDLTSDTFYHVALVKEGTTYSLYCNGVRLTTTTPAEYTHTGTETSFQLNATGGGTDVRFDEFRVSKVARYSGATYTVPTSPFTVD